MPVAEELVGQIDQLLAEVTDRRAALADLYKVAPQMGPAPLDVVESQVHLGSVAHDRAREVWFEQSLNVVVLSIGADREHGEVIATDRPQPRLQGALLVGRFIDIDVTQWRPHVDQFFSNWTEHPRDLRLALHDPTGAGRHSELSRQRLGG